MHEFHPLIVVGGIIGLFSAIFILAYAMIKDKKEAIGFDRQMKDAEIVKRLLKYARPHIKSFVFVLVIMLLTISYDIISPLLIGHITESLQNGTIQTRELFIYVGAYAGILVFSLVSTYIQAIVLQKTGQRIISQLREDLFLHIESLSHAQLNSMPVGKLVTRVTNDTNGVSMMFTNIIVNLNITVDKSLVRFVGLVAKLPIILFNSGNFNILKIRVFQIRLGG